MDGDVMIIHRTENGMEIKAVYIPLKEKREDDRARHVEKVEEFYEPIN